MTGTFLGVHHDPREHKCPTPKGWAHNEYPTHTVWLCDCGKAYRWQFGGTQYNEKWYEWARYPKMDVTP